MDLSVQILSLVLMIVLAYFYRNVWAMVAGGIIAAAAKMAWSHLLDRTIHNRFKMEKQAVSELLTFGKWIVLSTAMMFLATQADKLLLGKFFQLHLFGIYSIAMALAELPKQIVSQLSGKVIFPLIAQYANLPRPTLRQKILQKRKIFLILLAAMVATLAIFGDVLIKVLYDERYRQAGWMLPLLALGMWPLLLYVTIDPCLYVVGKPKYPALGNSLKFLYMLVCVPLFYFLAGKFGAILAVVLNDVPAYITICIGLKKEGLSAIRQDVWLTACLVGMLLLLLVFRYSLGMDFPGLQAYFP
jgi:O-antigen/teichoic acid export membrane protein